MPPCIALAHMKNLERMHFIILGCVSQSGADACLAPLMRNGSSYRRDCPSGLIWATSQVLLRRVKQVEWIDTHTRRAWWNITSGPTSAALTLETNSRRKPSNSLPSMNPLAARKKRFEINFGANDLHWRGKIPLLTAARFRELDTKINEGD